MTRRERQPGVSREARISDQGLKRLERQLQAGTIAPAVLEQWVRRYGDAARELIARYRGDKQGPRA